MHSSAALQLRRTPLDADVFESHEPAGLASRNSIELAAAVLPVFYPKGGMFFMEGQPVTGVFLLRSGRAKESMVSNKGKTAIVRVVGPGVILGLSAVLTDMPHESTAETIEPAHADFVRKSPFLRLLKTSAHLSQIVAAQLSSNCKDAYAAIRCLGLSGSVAEGLARLLLQWAEHPLPNQNGGDGEIALSGDPDPRGNKPVCWKYAGNNVQNSGRIPGKELDHHERQRLDHHKRGRDTTCGRGVNTRQPAILS